MQTEVDAAYKRVAQQNPEAWRRGVPYLLYLTMQYTIDVYYPLIDKLSIRLGELEEEGLSGEFSERTRSQNYRIKQQLIALRQMVAPQREVMSDVIGEESICGEREHRELFHHLYERLLRIYDLIDAQRDLSSNILDLIQGHETAQLSTAVSRLTIISMIFLPLTFIAGLLELNFITPEEPVIVPISGGVAFVFLLVFMTLIGGAMMWYFQKRGWV